MDVLTVEHRVYDQFVTIQVFFMHRDGVDLPVFVGVVVKDPFICIASAGIACLFKSSGCDDAAIILCYR